MGGGGMMVSRQALSGCDDIGVRDVHGMDEERIDYQDVAGLIEGADNATNEGVGEVHGHVY